MDSPTPNPQLWPPFRPVHTLSYEEIQQERIQIGIRIPELELYIHQLKQRHNTLSPISKLSPDVLLCVFEHLQSPFLHDTSGNAEYEPPTYPFILQTPLNPGPHKPEMQLDWVRAMTHVCSTWRALALETPTLWTRLRFKCEPLLDEMCRLSRAIPVSLICDTKETYRHGHPFLSEFLLETGDRIKHLEIAVPTVYIDQITTISDGLKSLSTSILEAFFCKTGGPDRGVDLPLGFLRNSSNNLQNEGLAHSIDPINLPSLLELTIANDAGQCAEALRHIIVPDSCVVSIATYDKADFGALNDALRAFWQLRWREGRPLKSVSIVRPSKPLHSTKICLGDDTKPLSKSFVLLLCGISPTDHRTTDVIHGFVSSLPGKDVSHLSVGIEINPRIWSSLSSSCPGVRSLEVRNKNLYGFLHALGHRNSSKRVSATDGGSNSMEGPIMVETFLSLETLTLDGFKLDVIHGRETLLEWIRNRVSWCIPLKGLNLLSCVATPDEFIENLRQLVEVVHSDLAVGASQ